MGGPMAQLAISALVSQSLLAMMFFDAFGQRGRGLAVVGAVTHILAQNPLPFPLDVLGHGPR